MIDVLMDRYTKADFQHEAMYVTALARSRVPEPTEHFRDILVNRTTDGGTVKHSPTTEYWAAVGLAQLGDPLGVERLVGHSEGFSGSLDAPYPVGVNNDNIKSSSIVVLRMLSGEIELTTREELRESWKGAKNGFEPETYVQVDNDLARPLMPKSRITPLP